MPGSPGPDRNQAKREFIQRPDGSKVPVEYYDLPPEQKARFDALLKEEESNAAGESQFDRVSLALLDQQSSQSRRIKNLERLVESLVGENMTLRRRQDGIDTSVETTKSAALVQQESAIAQQVTNLAAVKAEAESSAASIRREAEIQRLDHEQRLAVMEQPLAELEGRLKSSGTLYQKRANAVLDQLAAVEGRVAGADVQLTELENRTDALGSPITRPEVKDMVTAMVTAEVSEVAPVLIDKQVAEDRDLGVINPGGPTMDRSYMQQLKKDSNRRGEEKYGRDFNLKQSSKGRA